MEVADLLPLVERLEDNVDDLEEALQPLLDSSLAETSKKLPLLDKAKLHVLVTYTLESLLFSYLRLNGVNAKEHSVFKELTRVKQYFEKIKALETEPEKRTMALDKQAAGRFIKHGLAGNDKYDLARAEKEAKEKALAQMKAAMLAKKQSLTPQEPSAAPTTAPTSDSGSSSDSDSAGDDGEEEEEKDDEEEQPAVHNEASFIPLPSEPLKTAKTKSKERRQEARARKAKRKAKNEGKQQQPSEERDKSKGAQKRSKKAQMKKDRAHGQDKAQAAK